MNNMKVNKVKAVIRLNFLNFNFRSALKSAEEEK